MNIRRVANAANSAPFEIENVMPPTRISLSHVNFFCLLLANPAREDIYNSTI